MASNVSVFIIRTEMKFVCCLEELDLRVPLKSCVFQRVNSNVVITSNILEI